MANRLVRLHENLDISELRIDDGNGYPHRVLYYRGNPVGYINIAQQHFKTNNDDILDDPEVMRVWLRSSRIHPTPMDQSFFDKLFDGF